MVVVNDERKLSVLLKPSRSITGITKVNQGSCVPITSSGIRQSCGLVGILERIFSNPVLQGTAILYLCT